MPSKDFASRAMLPSVVTPSAPSKDALPPQDARSALGGGSRRVGHATPSRRIITGRRDCVTGLFPSGKPAMGYRIVAYEGRLSRDVIVLLENDPEVVSYQEEPPAFPWYDPVAEQRRSYTPDFAVDCVDGRRLCVEVRPWGALRELARADVLRERLAGALAAGYSCYEVRTERDVDPIRLLNASLVASERRFFADERALHVVRVLLDQRGSRALVAELRSASGLGSRAYRGVIGLIARGEAHPERPDLPIDDRSILVGGAAATRSRDF